MLRFGSLEHLHKHISIANWYNTMSIRSFAFALLVVAATFASVNPANAIRSYTIEKDFFNVIKSGEFSIFDSTEKNTSISCRI